MPSWENNQIPLDEPYQPLNKYIIEQQAMGKLAKLEPWDKTKTAREAIVAMRRHRGSIYMLEQHFATRSLALSRLGIGKAESLKFVINDAPYPKIATQIKLKYIRAAMLAWDYFEDKATPTQRRPRTNEMLPLTQPISSLNHLVEKLEENAQLFSEPVDKSGMLFDRYQKHIAVLTDIAKEHAGSNHEFAWSAVPAQLIIVYLMTRFGSYRTLGSFLQTHASDFDCLKNKSEKQQTFEINAFRGRLNNIAQGAAKSIRESDAQLLTEIYTKTARQELKDALNPLCNPDTIISLRPSRRAIYLRDSGFNRLISEAGISKSLVDLMGCLNKRERQVILLKYAKEYCDTEISEKMHLSRERIAQIHVQAIRKLRAISDRKGLRQTLSP